jgi:uncharacterized protein (DUF427 family)
MLMSADHPINIEPTAGRVEVFVNGVRLADSRAALTLRESVYPAVQYIPLKDVDPQFLSRSDTQSHCPYKGDASYYNVTVGDMTVDDAMWTYERPYDAVSAITGHVAFYPSKADIHIEVD